MRNNNFSFWRKDAFLLRLTIIVTIALVVRVLYVFRISQDIPLIGDAGKYRQLGHNLKTGIGYSRIASNGAVIPETWFPPGYPFILAAIEFIGFRSLIHLKLIMMVIGSGTVGLIGLIGRRLAGETIGLVAATLAACSPMLIVTDGSLGNETISVFVASGFFILLYRLMENGSHLGHWSALGALLSVAIYVRPEASTLFFCLAIPLAISQGKAWRDRIQKIGLVLLVCLACLSPFLIRNYVKYDQAFISLNGAGTLVGANCISTYEDPRKGLFALKCLGAAIEKQSAADPSAELFDQVQMMGTAKSFISEHLREVPSIMLIRAARTWGFFHPAEQTRREARQESRDYNLLALGYKLNYLLLTLSIVGGWALRKSGHRIWPLLAIIGQVTLTSMLVYGNARFRAVAEPAILLLSAAGIVFLAQVIRLKFRIRSQSSPRDPEEATGQIIGI